MTLSSNVAFCYNKRVNDKHAFIAQQYGYNFKRNQATS
jgi:hypothetical protein